MASFVPPDDEVRRLLAQAKNVAVVGLSDNPNRPSYGVARYLLEAGYRVLPVNPTHKEVMGIPCYADLNAIRAAGIPIDLVDVFRDPAHVMPIVEDAIAAGAPAIWFQEGVVNLDAARRAEAAGLRVVMDRCTMKEHARLVY